MRRVLITTEGSLCSTEAVRRFAALLGETDMELVLLSVVPPSRYPVGHPQSAEDYHRETTLAAEALDLATADLAAAGFGAYGVIRVGEPAETIVEVARERAVDMIVLGTHGRSGLERLLKGSVAEAVLAHAPCGVFIFPYTAAAAATV